MTNDHRALIEQVRKEHAERPVGPGRRMLTCGWDGENWPCLATRLADVLEQSIAYAINHGADLRLERDAALALCVSCGQDPAGGHNFGCPDGAGLGVPRADDGESDALAEG